MSRTKIRSQLLAAAGEPVGKLAGVLTSSADHKTKADACRELAVAGTAEAVPALAGLLGDEKLCHMARYGLEPIPDASVDEALRAALTKLKGRPLVGVAGSLGVRRDAKATGALGKLLGDSDPDVVRAAAGSLGRIATAEAAAALKAGLAAAAAAVCEGVADGCLSCAERLLAAGKKAEALALYETVAGKAKLREHVLLAAREGVQRAR